MPTINALVEGDLDEAVAARVINEAGHDMGLVYGRRGIGYVRDKIRAFNQSAHQIAYLTMVDLMDTRLPCAPRVRQDWLPYPNPGMMFRIVIREVESWLLADREGIADFLSVPLNRVPSEPEQLPDPKQALVNVARRSRCRAMQKKLVPANGSAAQTGRLYVTELRAFVQQKWNVANACANANSLRRCMNRLRTFTL